MSITQEAAKIERAKIQRSITEHDVRIINKLLILRSQMARNVSGGQGELVEIYQYQYRYFNDQIKQILNL